jgi:hypothetical protein
MMKSALLFYKKLVGELQSMGFHGGRDDLILSAIQAKSRSKSGHQRNSRQILQNRATELCRA